MSQRCRLKVPAQIDGALRDAGFIFILPTGKSGPMRSVRSAHERINNASGLYERIEPAVPPQDVLLYDVLEEIPDALPAEQAGDGASAPFVVTVPALVGQPLAERPIMSSPTDKPAQKGATDRMDGSF